MSPDKLIAFRDKQANDVNAMIIEGMRKESITFAVPAATAAVGGAATAARAAAPSLLKYLFGRAAAGAGGQATKALGTKAPNFLSKMTQWGADTATKNRGAYLRAAVGPGGVERAAGTAGRYVQRRGGSLSQVKDRAMEKQLKRMSGGRQAWNVSKAMGVPQTAGWIGAPMAINAMMGGDSEAGITTGGSNPYMAGGSTYHMPSPNNQFASPRYATPRFSSPAMSSYDPDSFYGLAKNPRDRSFLTNFALLNYSKNFEDINDPTVRRRQTAMKMEMPWRFGGPRTVEEKLVYDQMYPDLASGATAAAAADRARDQETFSQMYRAR